MQIGPVTENRVVGLNDETGYQSNRIFCHTNHFSSYKLEEAVGQDACTDTSMSFPGSAPVFSLNFSSAGWGSLRAGKAKNIHHRGALFRGQGGSGVRDMTLPLMGNLGAKGTSLIFANLQAVVGGKKCYLRR